jgi:hypothetical protein
VGGQVLPTIVRTIFVHNCVGPKPNHTEVFFRALPLFRSSGTGRNHQQSGLRR